MRIRSPMALRFLVSLVTCCLLAVTVPGAEVTLGDIIYAEDFEGETSWEIGAIGGKESIVEEGVFITNIDGMGGLISFCQCGPFSNFNFSVMVQQLAGSENVTCQIALHSQDIYGEGAIFVVIRRSETFVQRWVDGERVMLCGTHFGVDFSEPRKISVLSFEGTCAVYVDGSVVLFFSDTAFEPGDIGLGCGSGDAGGTSFAFDDIIVRSAVSTQADELEQQQANDGIIDLCDAWPSDLVGVAADEVSACGITVGMPLDSLLSMLEGQSYNTDLSGPLPQYSFGDIDYTVSANGYIEGIALSAAALPASLRASIEAWDEPSLISYFGDDCTFSEVLGIVNYLETSGGIKALRMGGSASVVLSLSEEEKTELNQASAAQNGAEELEFTVLADGSGDFATLELALVQAPDGATLHLGEGTFTYSDILLRSASIRIVGMGTNSTIVSSSASLAALLFLGDAAQIALEDIAFCHTGDSDADVVVCDAQSTYIANCSFSGGITDDEDSSSLGAGLRVVGDGQSEIINSIATRNAHGFVIRDGDSSIRGCSSEQNEFNGIVWQTTRGTIQQTRCVDNGLKGIAIYDGSDVELRGNTCRDNGDTGIYFELGSTGMASGNTCSRNGIGIAIEALDILVEKNTVSDNEAAGIVFVGNSSGICQSNACAGSRSGILIVDYASPLVQDNTCTKNSLAGIQIGGNSKPSILGNECTENAFSGIICEGESEATVEGNVCTKNVSLGIAFLGSSAGIARDNTASENEQAGIFVTGNSIPHILNNTCNANGMHGIINNEASEPTIEQNICVNNATTGMAYMDTAGGTAEQNTCNGNGIGIYISETARVILRDNICNLNLQAQIADLR